jgi:protein TonB
MRQALTVQLPEVFPPVTPAGRVVNVLVGLACAFLILCVLALSRRTHEPAQEPETYVARQATALVEEPPPVKESTTSEVLPVLSPFSLEIMPSADSPVRIQVPDTPLFEGSRTPPPARAVVATRFDLAKSAVKPPREDDIAEKRIFSRHEVDQRPMVLHRVTPNLLGSQVSLLATPRVVFLVVVTPDGTVGEVRLLQSSQDEFFDKAMMDAIREWRFSPAIRKGRKVNCWVQQAITAKVSGNSPFESQ